MLGLTGRYIMEVLGPTCDNFAGVFASDSIPGSLAKKRRFSCVVNLSRASQPGSHFISIHADGGCAIYIDPTGLPCFVQDITTFLVKCGRPVKYSSVAMQDPASPFCGFYCILAVLLLDDRKRESTPPPRIEFSETDLLSNDQKCVDYIKLILR